MNLIYLGSKVSSKEMLEASSKICLISKVLSEGTKFKRYHIEYLIQFLMQKY
jgi:hypothetical protein